MKYRMIVLILCLALAVSVPAMADVLGEPIDGCAAVLAEGVTLTERSYWTGGDYRTEHYITLEPGAAAVPTAVSGDLLWTQQSLRDAAQLVETRGTHVLGGSNGAYFIFETGEPVGLVISGGVLRTDSDGLTAVGFRPDGSAVLGNPGLHLRLVTEEEHIIPVMSMNRASGSGLRLYAADCTEEITPNGESACVLCEAEGALTPGGSTVLTVCRVWETEEPIRLTGGQMLLVMDKEWNGTAQTLPEALQMGAALTLEAQCDPDWVDVDSAVGLLYPLITDGEIVSGLEFIAAPRTAVGLKADGTVVLYTIDGRQSGYSVGTGLLGTAQRLKELGCVAAGALDGGGSTQMVAQMPGDGTLSTVNRPTESRKVVNYILIGTDAAPTGQAARLTLYPLHINAVSGAEIPLTVRATDKNGYAAALPQRISYTVSGGIGQIQDGVFYAKGTGSGTVTVSAPGLASAEIPVHVTASPEKLELYGEVYGKKTTALTLEPGQEVDLTVRAMDRHVLLTGDDLLYTWTLEPTVGTVDETGHVIPGEVSDTGLLTVAAGTSRVEIPITVWTGLPFRDVAISAPYFNAVKYVYDNRIFEGTDENEFSPQTVMSRAMLVTVLWRMCGRPETETPAQFADVPAESWFGPAVAWAAENGLVNGYSETQFGPEDDLTKEQILTILHRWAGLPESSGAFEDALEDAGDYARNALCWALENGLVMPDEETGLQPKGPMDRAAVAEVLMRWDELQRAEKENPEK